MSRRTWGIASAAAAALAVTGAFAAAGFGDDQPSAAGSDRFQIVRPTLERTGSPAAMVNSRDSAARATRPSRPKHPRQPKVTNLITTVPVAVAAGDTIVAELKCKRSQGIPLDGGAISPPAPAQVAISVISRFSPNPPFKATPGSYFVGVRNLDTVNPAEFRATLVCAKRLEEG